MKVKVRAWDQEENEMLYGSSFVIDMLPDGTIRGVAYYESDDFIPHTRELELMWSRGLPDKNGRDIYENDIVKYNDSLLLIKWSEDDAGFCYEVISKKNKNVIDDIRLYRSEEIFEVVGNIYENPELAALEKELW